MNKTRLTAKEKRESVFMTLGRLKTAIRDGKTDRALLLLEKVSERVSQMDIDLPVEKREVF